MAIRPLTHDEKKASEAAFRGLPFNPDWSQSARSVYDGIIQAMENTSRLPLPVGNPTPDVSNLGITPTPIDSGQTGWTDHQESETGQGEALEESTRKPIQSRREAIESGLLKDITPTAQSLGIDFAVGMTKPLWEHGIMALPDLTENEIEARVRDILLAVRLRLAGVKDPTPVIEVPVLLSFSSEPIPQLFPIYALFHKDPIESDCLLLIHPGEVNFTDRSFPQN